MVDGDIDNNPYALLVAPGDQRGKSLIPSQLLIHMEIIGTVKAMNRGALTNRIDIKTGNTKAFEVVQLFFNSLQISIVEVGATGLLVAFRLFVKTVGRNPGAIVEVVASLYVV